MRPRGYSWNITHTFFCLYLWRDVICSASNPHLELTIHPSCFLSPSWNCRAAPGPTLPCGKSHVQVLCVTPSAVKTWEQGGSPGAQTGKGEPCATPHWRPLTTSQGCASSFGQSLLFSEQYQAGERCKSTSKWRVDIGACNGVCNPVSLTIVRY